MRSNPHSHLVGKHAFLSASNNSWTNYDTDKLERVYASSMAARRGTELHELAQRLILLNVRLPDNGQTLSLYVNDAIGHRLTPEFSVMYSENAFGTADALGYRKYKLRVHDLKTGREEASFRQLEVYAAFFCLEYDIKPTDIEIELRIYQNDEVKILDPDRDDLFHIMDKVVTFDKIINQMKTEVT